MSCSDTEGRVEVVQWPECFANLSYLCCPLCKKFNRGTWNCLISYSSDLARKIRYIQSSLMYRRSLVILDKRIFIWMTEVIALRSMTGSMTAFRSPDRYCELSIVCHRYLERTLHDGLLLVANRIGAYTLIMYITTVAKLCGRFSLVGSGWSESSHQSNHSAHRILRSSGKYSKVYMWSQTTADT